MQLLKLILDNQFGVCYPGYSRKHYRQQRFAPSSLGTTGGTVHGKVRYMNALTVTHISPKNKSTFVMPMTTTIKPKTAWESYLAGQRKYIAGTGPEACHNADELTGWTDSLGFDADCETSMYLAKRGGVEGDAEWIARGC
jgi:hypothetical protein